MNAMCYIVLGTYIAYYKSVIKVDTMKQIKSMCLICVIVFTIAGLAHLGAVVFCAFFEDTSTASLDSTKLLICKVTTAVLQCLFFSLELSCFVVANRLTAKTLASMLVFHDYLISYRLTPRSRILRKHLPKMTMVLEEESCMDQSSIMMS